MDGKSRSSRHQKSFAARTFNDLRSPSSPPKLLSSSKSLSSSRFSPSLNSPSSDSLSSLKFASSPRPASPQKSGTAADDKLPRLKSLKQVPNAEASDVAPPPEPLPPPAPIQLSPHARIVPTTPCLNLGDYSTNTGIVPATDIQLHDVTRFCNGITHWLYLLQLIISMADATDLLIFIKTAAIPILMEYDDGKMWYLDVVRINFDEISQHMRFSQPECTVYNLNRGPNGQKIVENQRKKSVAGRGKSNPPNYTDTVYKFKFNIQIPFVDGHIDFKIRDPKNDRYGEQSAGYFHVKFKNLETDIRLSITETPKGNKNRYYSPDFELVYKLEDIAINPIYLPRASKKGETLPCTESTAKQLLADLRTKIFESKKEMASRVCASVIKKLKPKLKEMNSMIDVVNIFLPYIHKELIEDEEWLEKYLTDPKLTKVELELVKMLIFILEDSPKIRNMIQHMIKNQEKGLRILIPFIPEEEPMAELYTIDELNKIEPIIANGKKTDETIKYFKRLLGRETSKSSVSTSESDSDEDADSK